MMLQYLFFFLHLTFAGLVFFLLISFITGGPFVPSNRRAAEAMIRLAHLKPGTKVVDLGSGDGRLLFLAGNEGATAIGLEINPFLILWTRIRKILSQSSKTGFDPAERVTVRWKNFWKINLSDADVVFVYLLPWRMEKLKNKLENELKPGSLVVSNSFIFPGWKILRQDIQNHVYAYQL